MKPRRPREDPSSGDFFAADGTLSRAMPGYEYRPEQERMMEAVRAAITHDDVCLVEAGTGVGKTIAYLVPALSSGRQTIVVTGTRTLMDQVHSQDVPLLEQVLPFPFTSALLKGRSNYLCLRRLAEGIEQTLLKGPALRARLQAIRDWAASTPTGDVAQLRDLDEANPLLRRLVSRPDACLGHRCPRADRCFVLAARARARAADLIITNHHLFFVDLASAENGAAAILPRDAVVILDEAHHVENVATEFFGLTVRSGQLEDLCEDAAHLSEGCTGSQQRLLAGTLPGIREGFAALLAGLRSGPGASRFELEDLNSAAMRAWHGLDMDLEVLARECASIAASRGFDSEIPVRVESARYAIASILDHPDPTWIRLVTREGTTGSIQSLPLDVSETLRERLFFSARPVILTSATLTVDASTTFLRERLGVPEASAELVVDSPYDYARQALLYLPDTVPDPNDPAHTAAFAEEALRILELTRGRAFLLFTSHAAMNRAFEIMRDRMQHPVLRQGDIPREAMLGRFRSTPGACLFGTSTFWEGVDVMGEALSAVIIDRLPFDPPDDPVVSGRADLLRSRGKDPFSAYQLPLAVIRLRQGFGRLIRRRSDRGVIAILDPRIRTRPYGAVFLRSLPPATTTSDFEVLRTWCKAHLGPVKARSSR